MGRDVDRAVDVEEEIDVEVDVPEVVDNATILGLP